MNEYPFVTAIIVVRNEEKYIEKSFLSLLQQSYPSDKYEILIIDGLSEDGTLSVAKETEIKFVEDLVERKINQVQVRYLNNPKKVLASGWNKGIREAKGEYIVRIDAHSYVDKYFIQKSVETIQKIGDAVCVGGTLITKGLTPTGKLIAGVLSSPFGVGDSKFRYSQKPQYVDTVAYGLYKKEIFNKVGLFDERLTRNQDNDLHKRIRESGGKFYLNPEIKSTYYPRENIINMLRQGFNNGKWNIILYNKDPKSLSIRHLVPLFFVLGIVFLIIFGLFRKIFIKILSLLLLIHVLLGLVFAVKQKIPANGILFIPFIYLLWHISYGCGSLFGLFFHRVIKD